MASHPSTDSQSSERSRRRSDSFARATHRKQNGRSDMCERPHSPQVLTTRDATLTSVWRRPATGMARLRYPGGSSADSRLDALDGGSELMWNLCRSQNRLPALGRFGHGIPSSGTGHFASPTANAAALAAPAGQSMHASRLGTCDCLASMCCRAHDRAIMVHA